ncbi:MAG: CBS domain-containing protein [Desulfobacteraceae bacterium]|nr:MAG: CBS domain-containing protein [Desulfobacteraceae bacterium]
MVSLSEYATVSEDATLFEAVMTLEKAQEKYEQSLYPHRAILIYNKKNKITGKISQLDVLRALEPKYEKIIESRSLSRFGYSNKFLESIFNQYNLWENPLNDLCRKAGKLKVKNFMTIPAESEYITEDRNLDEAIHKFVMGNYQSLLVTREKEIVGILRLTDIFREISGEIKNCRI